MPPAVLAFLGLPERNIRGGVSLRQANSHCIHSVITAATGCPTVLGSVFFLATGMKRSSLPQQSCDGESRSMAPWMRLATLQVEADPVSCCSRASPKWAGWAAANFKDPAGSRWGRRSRGRGNSQEQNKNWQLTFAICSFQFKTGWCTISSTLPLQMFLGQFY